MTQPTPTKAITTCKSLNLFLPLAPFLSFPFYSIDLTNPCSLSSQITQTSDSLALLQQNVSICPLTKTLKVTAWGQAAKSKDCWLQLCVNSDSYCSEPTPLKKGKWKKNTLTYTPKKKVQSLTTAKVQIYTECRGEVDGTVWIDGVEIVAQKF